MRKKKLKKKLIYCAQDIRSWEGYRILQVKSNRLDRNVRITLINDDGHVVKLFLNDMCFDGEFMHYAEEPATPTLKRQGFVHGETNKKDICSARIAPRSGRTCLIKKRL